MSEAWKIEYNNDTGPNDEGFLEWFAVGPVQVPIPRGKEDEYRTIAEQVAQTPVVQVELTRLRAELAAAREALRIAIVGLDAADMPHAAAAIRAALGDTK